MQQTLIPRIFVQRRWETSVRRGPKQGLLQHLPQHAAVPHRRLCSHRKGGHQRHEHQRRLRCDSGGYSWEAQNTTSLKVTGQSYAD
jgi:hypothetical protein